MTSTLTSTTTPLFVVSSILTFESSGTQESVATAVEQHIRISLDLGDADEIMVTVTQSGESLLRRLSGASWEAYYEIVAPEAASEQFLQKSEGMASSADTGAALAQTFQKQGLELDSESVTVTEPEMKLITATMTSISSTVTTTMVTWTTASRTSVTKTYTATSVTSKIGTTWTEGAITKSDTTSTITALTATSATATATSYEPGTRTITTATGTHTTATTQWVPIKPGPGTGVRSMSGEQSSNSLVIIACSIGAMVAVCLMCLGTACYRKTRFKVPGYLHRSQGGNRPDFTNKPSLDLVTEEGNEVRPEGARDLIIDVDSGEVHQANPRRHLSGGRGRGRDNKVVAV